MLNIRTINDIHKQKREAKRRYEKVLSDIRCICSVY